MNLTAYLLKQLFNIALGCVLVLVAPGIAEACEWVLVDRLQMNLPEKVFYYVFSGFTGAGAGYALTGVAKLQKTWRQHGEKIYKKSPNPTLGNCGATRLLLW